MDNLTSISDGYFEDFENEDEDVSVSLPEEAQEHADEVFSAIEWEDTDETPESNDEALRPISDDDERTSTLAIKVRPDEHEVLRKLKSENKEKIHLVIREGLRLYLEKDHTLGLINNLMDEITYYQEALKEQENTYQELKEGVDELKGLVRPLVDYTNSLKAENKALKEMLLGDDSQVKPEEDY